MGKHIHIIDLVNEVEGTVECRNCGVVPLTIKKGLVLCSVARNKHRLKPGYKRKSNGYIKIWNGEAWISEHRGVMSKEIGRDLLPEETVHHINGVRDDNRIENLELWSSSHPRGQRVEDKVLWAKEILSLYDR